MNQLEEAKLLEQLEQWNDEDEYSRCIQAIETIPEQERGYLLAIKLSLDCEAYLEEEQAMELDWSEWEERIQRETPDDGKGVICK